MISRIEALNYRCLRYISQELRPFQILVGPNASGKSTLLDVIGFARDLLESGPEAALSARSSNFADLTWGANQEFEIAIEARIPDRARPAHNGRDLSTVRYELACAAETTGGGVGITWERVSLTPSTTEGDHTQRNSQSLPLFPMPQTPPATLRTGRAPRNCRTVVTKAPGGNDHFYSEVTDASGKGWMPSFRLGPRKSALANLPDDQTRFPAATWFRTLLREGVQGLVLNGQTMRRPSPPGQTISFRPDGSNLPWVIERLRSTNPDRFAQWLAHVRTALEDVRDIRTIERPEDKHRYLVLEYENGIVVPSWTASDGSLRLLALTVPAYLSDFDGIYLIEEPENGIHPQAVETVYQSLSSAYRAQILVASHSPVMLANARPHDVLCLAKTSEGATDVVSGDLHPRLREWQGQADLGALMASGIL